jgi:hypothetical protein
MCVTIKPVYDALPVDLGLEGFLYSYPDDVYMEDTPIRAALALSSALALCGMVALQLGRVPTKIELVLSSIGSNGDLPLPIGHPSLILRQASRHVVGFHGIPKTLHTSL